jgi:hypothetical protein
VVKSIIFFVLISTLSMLSMNASGELLRAYESICMYRDVIDMQLIIWEKMGGEDDLQKVYLTGERAGLILAAQIIEYEYENAEND